MSTITRTYEFVKDVNCHQKLWRVSPPCEYTVYDFSDGYDEVTSRTESADYVVTSGAVVFEPETYLFPSDKLGHILDWGELEGSFKGAIDHEKAIRDYASEATS